MPSNKSKRHKKETPSLSSPRHICNDSRHNSDQPCCQILTNFALQVFPPGEQETTTPSSIGGGGTNAALTTSNSSSGSTTITNSDEMLPTLLREYLLHERVQRKKKDLEASNHSKKKRNKKKKKKKATTAAEDNQQEADGEGITTITSSSAQEVAVEEDAKTSATTEMQSATETQQENGVVIPTTARTESGHNGIIGKDTTATTNKQAQRQTERQRRIQVLLDRFLDPRVEIVASGSTSSTTDPLQPLHSYIQSLTDDDDGFSSNSNHNKYGKDQSSSKSSSSFSFLPAAQVEQAVRALQCPSCRRDVERLLLSAPPPARQQYHEPPLRLTGVDVPTVHDPCYRAEDEEELEDQALQYQLLMEEGTEPPEHAEHWTLERICGAGGGGEDGGDGNGSSHLQGWKLRRPLASRTPVNGGGGEHAASENHTDTNNHWSMEELDFLLQQYVVLQGLDPDIITGATAPQQSTVTDNVVKSINDSVDSKTNAVATDFEVMAKRFQKSIEDFQTTREDGNASNSNNNASNVNWRNFPIQKEADEECDVILNELLRIILDVTRSVQFLLTHIGGGVDVVAVDGENNQNNGGSGESRGATAFAEARKRPMSREEAVTESHWATTQCMELWKSYLDAAHRIFQSMDQYEEKLLSLKQGPSNKIPEKFISSKARLLYYTYVNFKIKSVFILVAKIEKRLQHPTDIGMWTSKADSTIKKTTFLRRVLLEEAYYQFVSGEEKRPHLRKPAVDAACEDVVTTVREQTTTVHAPSVDKVLEEHQNRDEKLTRLLRNAGKHLDAMIQTGGEDVGVLKGMLQGIQAVNSTSQSANELTTLEAKRDYLKMRRSSLGPGLMKVLEHWVTYRLYHNISEHEKRIPPTMPYHLRKTMIPGAFPCHGGNERSRAACILVGLFFQRLSEGFKEWQALIAERELLTTVEVDESLAAAAQPTASKSSRKSKKKKAKKVTTVEVETDGQLERVALDGSGGVDKNEDESVTAPPLGDSVVEKSAESVVASVDVATQVSSRSHGGTTAGGAASLPVGQQSSSCDDEEGLGNKAPEKKDPELAEAPRRPEEKLQMSLDDDGGSVKKEEESMLLLSELYSSVKCGVHSTSGFETAESFLVGRLSALFESGDESLVIV